jgi:hypothetical protein
MAQRKVNHPARQQRRTALLVGEGLAEQVFLSHLKALYVVRGHKQVTVKNAKGKGGAHVLDYTRRQGLQAAFDETAALLDTDTDWGDEQRALAKKWGIEVIEAQPCLEALLLRIAGQRVPHATEACKKAFAKQFGAPAHEAAVLERHFTQAVLDKARAAVPALEQLVQFLLR